MREREGDGYGHVDVDVEGGKWMGRRLTVVGEPQTTRLVKSIESAADMTSLRCHISSIFDFHLGDIIEVELWIARKLEFNPSSRISRTC